MMLLKARGPRVSGCWGFGGGTSVYWVRLEGGSSRSRVAAQCTETLTHPKYIERNRCGQDVKQYVTPEGLQRLSSPSAYRVQNELISMVHARGQLPLPALERQRHQHFEHDQTYANPHGNLGEQAAQRERGARKVCRKEQPRGEEERRLALCRWTQEPIELRGCMGGEYQTGPLCISVSMVSIGCMLIRRLRVTVLILVKSRQASLTVTLTPNIPGERQASAAPSSSCSPSRS